MIHDSIEFIINRNIGSQNIMGEPRIKICPINKQVEEIEIILSDDDIPLGIIGDIIEELDQYTQHDGYGDITELTFKLNRLHLLPDGNVTTSLTLSINIDS